MQNYKVKFKLILLIFILIFCNTSLFSQNKRAYINKSESYVKTLVLMDSLCNHQDSLLIEYFVPQGKSKQFYIELSDSLELLITDKCNLNRIFTDSLEMQNDSLVNSLLVVNKQLKASKFENLTHQKNFDSLETILHQRLEIKYKTDFYTITPLPDREVIVGKRGFYFSLEIHEPYSKEQVFFNCCEYTLDNITDKKFLYSFGKFCEDVLLITEMQKRDYEIFVRGSADIGTNFTGTFNPRYIFERIEVLRKNKQLNQFEYDVVEKEVPKTFQNKHLPNLRANYIKILLSNMRYIEEEKVHILDGEEKFYYNPTERNVLMLLYINYE